MLSHNFEEIYQLYSDKVYGYIYLLVRQKDIAEDLTQETFIKAYRYLNQFKGESSIYTWLIKIARNTVYDFFRRKKLVSLLSFKKEPITEETPQEILLKGEEVRRLYETIMRMKTEYRDVLILRKVKELSIKETAEILDWDEVKVKNTTSRAMQSLKKLLTDKEGGLYERFSKN